MPPIVITEWMCVGFLLGFGAALTVFGHPFLGAWLGLAALCMGIDLYIHPHHPISPRSLATSRNR